MLGLIKKVDNVNLEGIVTCLPLNKVDNNLFEDRFTKKEISQIASSTGVKVRYYASTQQKTSDLCLEAAKHLINKLNWKKESIDGLIFITQTPDKLIPATSNKLQFLLGLSSRSFAFDINLGCSAYPYGLWVASSLLQTGAKRVLILVGDTISKLIKKDDRATAFLFGDAGSASALSLNSDSPMKFILGSDGQGSDNIKAEYKEKLEMNGSKVFEFSISRVPELLKQIDLANGGKHDLYFFHQANKFMLNYLKKKCQINNESFPLNIESYGNTSSASIPLLITDYFKNKKFKESINIALLGFGVGFSWSAASLDLKPNIYMDKIFVNTK